MTNNTNILTSSRKTLFSNVHAMILELKHINQTPQSLNKSDAFVTKSRKQSKYPSRFARHVCLFCQANFHPSKSLNIGERDWLINT